MATAPLLDLGVWIPILDGDPFAAAMYERHYSSAKSRQQRAERKTMQFGGPGQRLILMTPQRDALFGWRHQLFRADEQRGAECFIFRNEGIGRSSALIRAACAIADGRWRKLRQFTFVDHTATQAGRGEWSRPGHCFLKAGWRYVRDEDGRIVLSESGLHILERTA